MKLHPRTLMVQKASNEFSGSVIALQEKYDLTTAEILSCISQELAQVIKWELRAERHPNDPDAKADEE